MDNKLFPERLDRNQVYECEIFSLYTDKVKFQEKIMTCLI